MLLVQLLVGQLERSAWPQWAVRSDDGRELASRWLTPRAPRPARAPRPVLDRLHEHDTQLLEAAALARAGGKRVIERAGERGRQVASLAGKRRQALPDTAHGGGGSCSTNRVYAAERLVQNQGQ